MSYAQNQIKNKKSGKNIEIEVNKSNLTKGDGGLSNKNKTK